MPRPFLSLLLALSVLAGQWLAATHDSRHDLAPNASHSCAICVYAHAAGGGVLPAAPALALDYGTETPEGALDVAAIAAPARHVAIRGPPQFL